MTLEVQLNRLISELQQLRVSVEALAGRMDRLEKEPRSDFKFGPAFVPSYPTVPYITCRSKD
jgi:hypothetical protein